MISVLRITLGACLISAACSCATRGNGDSESFLWFSVTQSASGELQIHKDYSYEYMSELDGGTHSSGKLDEVTVATLQSYFTDANIAHYVEGHQDFSEDCRMKGTVIHWWQGITACWYRAEVTDTSTAEMLDYVDQLRSSIAQ